MRPVSPDIEGVDEHVIAEEQLEFMPISAAYVTFNDDPQVHRICRWTFTPEERAKIAVGEDIYFGTLADNLLMPHWLRVGFP